MKKTPIFLNLERERQRQLRESLEVINALLDSQHRTHVVDGIREILRQRQKPLGT